MPQLRLFDNATVDQFVATMSGSVDIEDEDIRHFTLGNTVVLVQVASIKSVTIKETREGDAVRRAMLGVSESRVATGELLTQLLAMFGLGEEQELPFPTSPAASPASPATGAASPSAGVFSGDPDLAESTTTLPGQFGSDVDWTATDNYGSPPQNENLPAKVSESPAFAPQIPPKADDALAKFLEAAR